MLARNDTQELDEIRDVTRIERPMTFCQIPDMVRVHESTVGVSYGTGLIGFVGRGW